MTELVDAEYQRLVRQAATLKQEHAQLCEKPDERESRESHHARVLAHISELRAHIQRLQVQRSQT